MRHTHGECNGRVNFGFRIAWGAEFAPREKSGRIINQCGDWVSTSIAIARLSTLAGVHDVDSFDGYREVRVAGRCSRATLDARGTRVQNDLRGRIVEIVVREKLRSVGVDFTWNMLSYREELLNAPKSYLVIFYIFIWYRQHLTGCNLLICAC